MSKPLIGILLGAVLGAIDGLTAWFTPAVREQLAGIVVSSTFKGIHRWYRDRIFCQQVHSLPLGILFGLAVGALPGISNRSLCRGWLLFRNNAARDHGRFDRRLCHAEVWKDC